MVQTPHDIAGQSHANCKGCGAWKNCRSPFMESTAGCAVKKSKPSVLVVMESPNESEDFNGELIPERSTRHTLVRSALKAANIDPDLCQYTVAVKCCPAKNKGPSTGQINACGIFLRSEISQLRPRAVLMLGNAPLRALFKKSGITKARRQVFQYKLDDGTEIPCVASFSPGFVARDENQRDRFMDDIKFFGDVVESGQGASLNVKVNIAPSPQQVIRFHREAVAKKTLVVTDTETDELHVYTRDNWLCLCIGFSNGPENIVVQFDTLATGRVTNYSPVQKAALAMLMAPDMRWAGHNFKYDWHVFNRRFGIRIKKVTCDTMLLHTHVFPVQGGHDLKTVSMEELGVGDYTTELRQYIGDGNDSKKYATCPYPVLAKYCGMDVYCTRRLVYKLLPRMKRMDTELIKDGSPWIAPSVSFSTVLMPMLIPLAELEATGVFINLKYLDEKEAELEKISEEALSELRSNKLVRKYENKKRTEIIAEYRDKQKDGKRVSPTMLQKELKKCIFNPNSPQQVAELIYGREYLNAPVIRETDSGAPATGVEVLEILAIEYADKLRHEFGHFTKHLQTVKKTEKLNGTYVGGLRKNIGTDGRVHTTIRPFGADTGRTASADPNLQNIPRDKSIKRIYCVRRVKGKPRVFIEADYSQLELRLAAAYSNDTNMVSVYAEGRDLHRETASSIFGIPAEKVTDAQRTNCKPVNFGVVYGLTAHGLARNLTIETKRKVEEDEAQTFIDGLFNAYPALEEWQDDMRNFAEQYGYVYTMFGSRRLLKNAMLKATDSERRRLKEAAFRQAVNTPIQGTGGLFALVAISKLSKLFKTKHFVEMGAKLLLTVHDSIAAECYEEYRDTVARAMRSVMINEPLKYVAKYMNGVPIEVDVKTGPTWGDLTDLKLTT